MKQIFYFFAFTTAGIFIKNAASAQYDHHWNDTYQRGNNDCRNDGRQSFYYYPQSNVYFSLSTQQYIYPYRGSWVVSERLPHRLHLRDEPRVMVMHDGFDVWSENRFHAARFGSENHSRPDVAYDRPQDRYDDRNRVDNRQDDHYNHRDDNWRK